jgi:hypothetical protein
MAEREGEGREGTERAVAELLKRVYPKADGDTLAEAAHYVVQGKKASRAEAEEFSRRYGRRLRGGRAPGLRQGNRRARAD